MTASLPAVRFEVPTGLSAGEQERVVDALARALAAG